MGNNNFMDGYGMMGGWGFGPLGMLLIFTLIILGIAWMVKAIGGNAPDTRISALEILEERFARGEIDEAEFQKRRQQLGS